MNMREAVEATKKLAGERHSSVSINVNFTMRKRYVQCSCYIDGVGLASGDNFSEAYVALVAKVNGLIKLTTEQPIPENDEIPGLEEEV